MDRLRGGLLAFVIAFLRRSGIRSPSRFVSVDQFSNGHRCGIAEAEPSLQNARIATGTVGVTRTQCLEQLRHHGLIADAGESLTTRMKIATLGKRNESIGNPAQFFRLWQCRYDLLVFDECAGEACEQRTAVR